MGLAVCKIAVLFYFAWVKLIYDRDMLIFNLNTPIGIDVLMGEYSLFTVALGLENRKK